MQSFRCYADGLNFSADLVKDDMYDDKLGF